MKSEIGKRVSEIRKGMNLNKEQFAKLIGISGQYLGTVETGVHGLSLNTFMTICEKTNTSADYLLFGRRNITDENIKNVFENIDKEQIVNAFDTLENFALLIRNVSSLH